MKLISSSAARRRTASAPLRSFGGPQMPSPVRRMAPNPRRCTEISPPSETTPATDAESSFLFTMDLQNTCFDLIPQGQHHNSNTEDSSSYLLLLSSNENKNGAWGKGLRHRADLPGRGAMEEHAGCLFARRAKSLCKTLVTRSLQGEAG